MRRDRGFLKLAFQEEGKAEAGMAQGAAGLNSTTRAYSALRFGELPGDREMIGEARRASGSTGSTATAWR